MGKDDKWKWIVCALIISLVVLIFYEPETTTSINPVAKPILHNQSVIPRAVKTFGLATKNPVNEIFENVSEPFSIRIDPNFSRQCFNLYNGSASNLTIQRAINVKKHQYRFSEYHKKSWLSNFSLKCDDYFAYHGYFNTKGPLNMNEENYAIAFGILIYHEIDQFEQLFRAIYRLQNFYCVHVDDSAERSFKDMVSSNQNFISRTVLSFLFAVPRTFLSFLIFKVLPVYPRGKANEKNFGILAKTNKTNLG